jgi:hypothetical protein
VQACQHVNMHAKAAARGNSRVASQGARAAGKKGETERGEEKGRELTRTYSSPGLARAPTPHARDEVLY